MIPAEMITRSLTARYAIRQQSTKLMRRAGADSVRHGPSGTRCCPGHTASRRPTGQRSSADVFWRRRLHLLFYAVGGALPKCRRRHLGLSADAQSWLSDPDAAGQRRYQARLVEGPWPQRRIHQCPARTNGHYWQGRFGCVALDEIHLGRAADDQVTDTASRRSAGRAQARQTWAGTAKID